MNKQKNIERESTSNDFGWALAWSKNSCGGVTQNKYNSDNKLKVVGYGSPVFQVDDLVSGQKSLRFRHGGGSH